MPRVPMYEEQVAPRALPTPNVAQPAGPDNYVGEGIGKIANAVAGTALPIIDKEISDVDHARVDAAEVEYQKHLTETLYNPTQGYITTKRGVNALDTGPVSQALSQKQDAIAAGLSNDEQRKEFLKRVTPQAVGALRTVEQHAGNEFQQYRKENADALAEGAIRTATENYNDPIQVEAAAKSGLDPLIRHLRDQGAPPAAITAAADRYRETIQTAALQAYLDNGDAIGAKKYLEQVRPQLGPRAKVIEHSINVVYEKTASDAESARIVSANANPLSGLVDEQKAMAEVSKMPAGTLRTATEERVKERVGIAQAQHKQKGDALYAEALSYLIKGGYSMSAIPAPMVATLTDSSLGFSPQYQKLREDIVKAQAEARNQPPTLPEVQAQAALAADMKDNSDRYATMSATDFVASPLVQSLPPKVRQKAVDDFKSAHAAGAKPFTFTKPEEDRLLEVGRDSGLFPGAGAGNDPKKWGAEQAGMYSTARQRILEKGAAWRKSHGKDPDEATVDAWLLGLLKKQEVPGTGIKVPFTDIRLHPTKVAPIEKSAAIPPEARKALLDSLPKGRAFPSEDELLQKYNAGKARGIFK